ncbi:MAG TPA: oxalate/formate MFS antiporter [Candidatus Baltobacteraceae bacterium]|nr:oxalate/formate MFS antiporter [Candidatus Baltobacteraceae bacterium]
MSSAQSSAAVPRENILHNHWVQLIAGIVCMAMIANLQYGWTVFVNPIHTAMGWSRAAIQVSFTLFVLVESWLVPFEAALADRFGPRRMVIVGGLFAAAGWVVNSYAYSLETLYLGGILAGIGAGIVYGTCIGNAIKWFAGNRGLAAGLTAMGFGAGAALTVIPLTLMVANGGYRHAFLMFGLIQGLIVVVAAMFLLTPPATHVPDRKIPTTLQGTHDYKPMETLRSPVFWVMYVMFTLVAAGGLMAVAQLGPIAKDFGIAKSPVTILLWTLPTLTYALSINNLVNGFTRPILGWVSDRIGRELTMFFAFMLEGIGIVALMEFGHSPVTFVLLSGVVFFAWGEIFSIFPATARDHFGQKYATTNYGMLYTAKGTAALIVPLASVLTALTGSWTLALSVAAVFNVVAAVLSLLVLRPLRVHEIHEYVEAHQPAAASS